MNTMHDIRLEIERATDRRAEAWRRLGEGRTPELVTELKQLEDRIARLWDEHRELRARIRFGERERIIARARTEERLARAA